MNLRENFFIDDRHLPPALLGGVAISSRGIAKMMAAVMPADMRIVNKDEPNLASFRPPAVESNY
jgi:hypothetical protein